jgi:xylulokinase
LAPDAGRAGATARFVLAVDLGTGGPKVGLVSTRGEMATTAHVPVDTVLLPGGGAVQDAGRWWEIITEAARTQLASGAVPPDQVVAVSCTGQWASTVPVDDAGRPVGDCVLWLDTRGGPHTRRRIGGPVAGYDPRAALRWVRHTGGAPSTSGADPVGHILYLEAEEPAVSRAARWYLEPVDYLAMRFTGRAAASPASMTAAWLTDNRDLTRLGYDDALVRRAGLPADKLPPLVPTCSVVGEVLGDLARDLGLPDGVVVVAGTPDLHSATAGAGTVGLFDTHLVISTTSWVSCPVGKKKTDLFRQIASVPGLGPDHYLVANNHETGGRCLEWVRDALWDDGADAPPSYEALTTLAATAPAGSGGVLFTPWLAGERSPVDDRAARGGFHNLSLGTDRAAMVRAVLEGVAYNSRWLFDAVERFAGARLEPVRVVGGGAASDLWCQIHADVLDRRVERVAAPLHANLRGAALLAGLALGDVTLEEIRHLVVPETAFDPNPATRRLHEDRYAEFPKLYTAQKKMFGRMNRVR